MQNKQTNKKNPAKWMRWFVTCFKLRMASSLQVLIYPLSSSSEEKVKRQSSYQYSIVIQNALLPLGVIRIPLLFSKGLPRRIIVVTADYLSLLLKKRINCILAIFSSTKMQATHIDRSLEI